MSNSLQHASLIAPLCEAETAVNVLREKPPGWLSDDDDEGWKRTRPSGFVHNVAAGVEPKAADTIRVGLVYRDCEYIAYYLPLGPTSSQSSSS